MQNRAKEILDHSENKKIVLYLNYFVDLSDLKKYNPIIVTGIADREDRKCLIEIFRKSNRPLIIEPSFIHEIKCPEERGITLHDLSDFFIKIS